MSNFWGVPEPTSEQCSAHAPLKWKDQHGNERSGFAIWYPQMGGYVGRAVVDPTWDARNAAPGCFEAWVWHDGEFPFSDASPINLHHCSPDQFVDFGAKVAELSRP